MRGGEERRGREQLWEVGRRLLRYGERWKPGDKNG